MPAALRVHEDGQVELPPGTALASATSSGWMALMPGAASWRAVAGAAHNRSDQDEEAAHSRRRYSLRRS